MKAILLIFLFPVLVFCQQAAFFETTIYFEDAIGNKDSLVVGYDPTASDGLNEHLGEIDISDIPYDSAFEARAVHFNAFNSSTGNLVQSKKIIGYTNAYDEEKDCYPIVEPSVFLVHSKYQPVTVTWDNSDFNNSECRVRSMILSHTLPMIIGPGWWDQPGALELSACMAEDSSFTTFMIDTYSTGFYRIEEVEDVGLDTVHALLLHYRFLGAPSSPCTANVIVNAPETHETVLPTIFPNPTNGYLYMENPKQTSYGVWDISGNPVRQGTGFPIDLNGLPAGLYCLRIGDRIEKIVKQ